MSAADMFWACRQCWRLNSGVDPTWTLRDGEFRPVSYDRGHAGVCWFCQQYSPGDMFLYAVVDDERTG